MIIFLRFMPQALVSHNLFNIKKRMVGFQIFPKLKENNKQNEISGQKRFAEQKKQRESLGWNTVLPDKNFRFCGQKASLFCIWKPVLLQCLFLNRATKLSICSHQSLNKKKAFPFDELLTFVLCCTKKNTWRRLLFVEEFYRAKPALQSFSLDVSFPKKKQTF